jgi:hypothetical protein
LAHALSAKMRGATGNNDYAALQLKPTSQPNGGGVPRPASTAEPARPFPRRTDDARDCLDADVFFGTAGATRAEWVSTLEPPQSRDGGVVTLRVEDTEDQCFNAGDPLVQRNGNAIKAAYGIEDFQPPGTPAGVCPGYRVTPRLDSLGAFATGNYTIEVVTCSNPAIGPPCVTQTTLNLSVFGSTGQRLTVPTMSGAIVILLVFAVLATGAFAPKRP